MGRVLQHTHLSQNNVSSLPTCVNGILLSRFIPTKASMTLNRGMESNVPPLNTYQSRIDWGKKRFLGHYCRSRGPFQVHAVMRESCKSQPWLSVHSWCFGFYRWRPFHIRICISAGFFCIYIWFFFPLRSRQVTVRGQTLANWLLSSLVFESGSTWTNEMGGILYHHTVVNSLVRRILVVWEIM